MKRALWTAALLTMGIWPVAARADSWCIRDSARTLSPICAFSSAQECIHAAIVGPSGVVCVPDEAETAVEVTKKAPRKRHARAHWG
jgi:hypothetical protein